MRPFVRFVGTMLMGLFVISACGANDDQSVKPPTGGSGGAGGTQSTGGSGGTPSVGGQSSGGAPSSGGGDVGGTGGVGAEDLGVECVDEQCPSGLTPVEFCGIAGCDVDSFCTCEIPCEDDPEVCPEGSSCATISDGPGTVCVRH